MLAVECRYGGFKKVIVENCRLNVDFEFIQGFEYVFRCVISTPVVLLPSVPSYDYFISSIENSRHEFPVDSSTISTRPLESAASRDR